MRRMMRVIIFTGLFLMIMSSVAGSAGFGDLIINEINWAGNVSSSNAEWIEIYNMTDNAVLLSGWTLYETNTDQTSEGADLSVEIPDEIGALAANSYFIIADDNTIGTITIPELTKYYYISSFSGGLRNAGEQIILKDNDGIIIDVANLPYTAWFAGSSSPRRSMERNDDLSGIPLDGTLAGSWSTCILELGTPGLRNSSSPSPVPLPPAFLFMGSGLLGLGIFHRGSRCRLISTRRAITGPEGK